MTEKGAFIENTQDSCESYLRKVSGKERWLFKLTVPSPSDENISLWMEIKVDSVSSI